MRAATQRKETTEDEAGTYGVNARHGFDSVSIASSLRSFY